MPRKTAVSTVLTLRVTPDLDRRLTQEARRTRRTRGETARTILEAVLSGATDDPAAEARRQSLVASGRPSEREALRFVAASADRRGWR
jgi:predicted transcriptional regulator